MKKKNEVKKVKIETDKALILKGVNKKYHMEGKRFFQALFDINLEFERGELVSIMGESGSGKSTLMNIIGGLDSDFTGDIIAGGENLRTLSESELDKYRKNKIGFVFQSFNLISHLSILDNVTLALTLSNVSEKEKVRKATEILSRVGLSDQLKKKPNQLSGGQRQRVAIARALINDPEIIIADEPTGALDSTTTLQILEILKEIADSGKLVIMVTHSEKVASISSRVVEISDGRIISDRKNENYVKSTDLGGFDTISTKQKATEEPAKSENEKENNKKAKKTKKRGKERQNLSVISAIKLSFHNMWANKTKNILMSIGVGIGIGSLILMMCFSSGITDYIDDTMTSFSDPTIVTITRKSESMTDMLGYNPFGDTEVSSLVGDINNYLTEKGYDFQVSYDSANENENNLSYGIQMMTMTSNAKVIYDPSNVANDGTTYDYFTDTTLEQAADAAETSGSVFSYKSIIYLYTIPPYYTDTNVSSGSMATSSGGIMFTSGIKDLFDDKSITNSDGSSKVVDVAFTYTDANSKTSKFIFTDQTVTGIMDASVMSGILTMYIDYDYFQTLFADANNGSELDPNVLYIKTTSAEITDVINEYLDSTGAYSGSVEESLATMFTSMSSIIGTSLVVISCISLIVSAMMILVVLYMSVSERTKEIGVLKSIGARRKDIKRIFTSESFLVGLLSAVCGIIFNLILTLIIVIVLNSLIGLAPISYKWWYFLVAFGVSLVISMLSGLYPASKAAKLDPVESLRRE